MSRKIEYFDGLQSIKSGRIDSLVKHYDLIACVKCQKLQGLKKIDLDKLSIKAMARYFCCMTCDTYCGVLVSRIIEFWLVAKLDSKVMSVNNTFAKAQHMQAVFGWCLPKGELMLPSMEFMFGEQQFNKKPLLWIQN